MYAHFRQKIGVFLKNQRDVQFFAKIISSLSKKQLFPDICLNALSPNDFFPKTMFPRTTFRPNLT
jgi:hypothetical protein